MALTNREKYKRWRERHPETYHERNEVRTEKKRQKSDNVIGRFYAVELIDPNDNLPKAVFVAHHKDSPKWKKLLRLSPDTPVRQWLESVEPIAVPVWGMYVPCEKLAAAAIVQMRAKELIGKLLFPEDKSARRVQHKRQKARKAIPRISQYRPDR